MRKNIMNTSKIDTYSFIKKLLIAGTITIGIAFIIKNIVRHHMEMIQKISKSCDGSKEYTAAFEKKGFRPGCSFKNGGIRSMCSAVTFDINDLKANEDVSITCNAIMSGIEIIVPEDVNVITYDVSKLSGIANVADRPYNADNKTIKLYVSGFMSGIFIKRAPN